MSTRRGFLATLTGLFAGLAGARRVKADAVNQSAKMSLDQACYRQFQNGILVFPRGWVEPSKKELERLYAKWLARWQGDVKYGTPLVLKPGMKIMPLAPLSLETR